MNSQDGYSIKEKALKILDRFSQDAKVSVKHCDLIIEHEFYGSTVQNEYKKIKSKILEIEIAKKIYDCNKTL